MKKLILPYVFVLFLPVATFSQTVKILFDCTKAETAGNADWVIDADLHNIDWESNDQIGTGTGSNPQRFPTPLQNTVTSTTAETYWEGSLSSWGIDCVNYGYEVETLPPTGLITYGDTSNPQDLSNYKVYVVDEPNIRFTQTEKNAMLNFVKNGGGLFMISDHNNSDRNNDGWDSPNIWNDFLNTVTPVNPFGLKFDLDDFSPATTNVSTSTSDSLTRGPYGTVAALTYSGATIIHTYPDTNSTATGDIWMQGVSQLSHDSIMFAHAHFGSGKVAAIADSSPEDDGTGNPACTLYSAYSTADNGSDRKLLMNAIIWLAESPTMVVADSLHLLTTADTTLCTGNSLIITAAGANSYSWSPGGATTASITVQPSATGLYIVTGTTGGVSEYDTVKVTVDQFSSTTPQISAGGPLTFCTGGTVTLNAPSESLYLWSSGATSRNITVAQSGSYSVSLTDANGCKATSNSISVSVDAFSQTVPQISANGPISFCTGGNVSLSAAAGYTYHWNNSSTQQTVTVTQSGNYFLTVTDANNCSAKSDTVSVNATSGNFSGVQVSPSNNETICAGANIVLSAPVGYTYLWNTGSTQQNITVSQPGQYYFTVTAGGNCHGISDTAVVTVDNFPNSSPPLSATGPLTFCTGDSVVISAPASSIYNWSSGSQQQVITVNQTGVYQATVTDANQCSAVSQALTVTVNPLPQVSFSLNSDSVCLNAGSLQLNGTPSGGIFSGTGINGSQFEPGVAGSGTFAITYNYTDNNGCSNSSSNNLTVYVCTGLQVLDNNLLSVFPNPSSGEFVFQLTGGFIPDAITIFDDMGRKVMDINNLANKNRITVDMKNLSSGIYVAILSKGEEVIRRKLVKTE